jgi:ABC-2 type transport system permease protein
MNLWHLEWLRLVRTQRWLILLAVFGSVGVMGPATARYLPELMESLGEEAVGSIPPMTAVDGITQYLGNALQFGVLAVAFVGAAALAFDSKAEIAVFFRTRASVSDIFVPRFVISAAASVLAFGFGMLIAYVGTGVLLEWLDIGPVVVGALLFMLYLVFSVAVIGVVASFLRSVPGVALLSVGALIALGLLSIIGTLAPWLPGALIGAVDALIRGGEFDYWRSIIVTVVLIAAMVAFAIRRLEGREV